MAFTLEHFEENKILIKLICEQQDYDELLSDLPVDSSEEFLSYHWAMWKDAQIHHILEWYGMREFSGVCVLVKDTVHKCSNFFEIYDHTEHNVFFCNCAIITQLMCNCKCPLNALYCNEDITTLKV